MSEREAAGELARAPVVDDEPSPWLRIHQAAVKTMMGLSMRLAPELRKRGRRTTRRDRLHLSRITNAPPWRIAAISGLIGSRLSSPSRYTPGKPGRRQQIDNMLGDRPWREVADSRALRPGQKLALRPWEIVPCELIDRYLDGDPLRGGDAAAKLRDRMAKLGISRWHPSPIEAIAEAEAAMQQAAREGTIGN